MLHNTLRGIACEMWGGLSGTCDIDGTTGFTGGCKHSRCPVPAAHSHSDTQIAGHLDDRRFASG